MNGRPFTSNWRSRMNIRSVPCTGLSLLTAMILALISPVLMSSQTPGAQLVDGILQFRLELDQLSPLQISVPEGRYLIRIMNGVYLDELEFEVNDEGGRKLNGGKSKARTPRTQFIVDLRGGKHFVRVPKLPKMRAEIAVTGK